MTIAPKTPAVRQPRVDQKETEPDNIVFYWSGVLPAITELCLASALCRSKSSRIHLYLDDDEGFESSTNPDIGWLSSHPRVIIHHFKLSEWLNDAIGAARWTGPVIVRRLATKVLNRWMPSRISLSLSRLTAIQHLVGHFHSFFGWFPNMSHQHALRTEGLAHRADVFRVLVPLKFPRESVLYADLDVYFAAPFTKWDFRSPFTYQWGRDTWANTAILFFPKKRKSLTQQLLHQLSAGTPALPWFLFSLENCQTFGIDILPVGSFDPGWTTGSVSWSSSEMFFQNNEFSTAFLNEISLAFLAVHWHNQWQKVPEIGSPFHILLEESRKGINLPKQLDL